MFLVLHGQTEWNRDGKLQGHRDSPLTDEGRRQVDAAVQILKAHLPEPRSARVVASPLGRTQATARIVAEQLGLASFETDARLAELHLGEWEGLTRTQLREGWAERMSGGVRNSWFFRAPGGEDYDTIRARLGDWLAEQTAHDNLIAVSHGIASRVLRGLYGNLPLDEVCGLEVARDCPRRLWNGADVKLALA